MPVVPTWRIRSDAALPAGVSWMSWARRSGRDDLVRLEFHGPAGVADLDHAAGCLDEVADGARTSSRLSDNLHRHVGTMRLSRCAHADRRSK
jgi:hypothetical protein